MYKLLGLIALAALVVANDLAVGPAVGDRIFNETLDASPALFWRQDKNVTVNATDGHVISRVVITDLRPDKDGEAAIVEGGQGEKNVTIELKSPAVLRGFEFNVEVYVVPESEAVAPSKPDTEGEDEQKAPIPVTNESTDSLRNTRKTDEDKDISTVLGTSTTLADITSTPVSQSPVATAKVAEESVKVNIPVDIGKDVASTETQQPADKDTGEVKQTATKAPADKEADVVNQTETKVPADKEADVVNAFAVQNQPTHMNNSDSPKATKILTLPRHLDSDPPRFVRDAIPAVSDKAASTESGEATTEKDETTSTTESDVATSTGYEATTELESDEDLPVIPQFNWNVRPLDVIKPVGEQGLSPPKTIGADNVAVHNHPAFTAPLPYNH